MTIPKSVLDKWQLLRTHGDMQKIAAKAGVSAQSIRNAFLNEETNEEIFKAIADFYEEKIKMISAYIPQLPAHA